MELSSSPTETHSVELFIMESPDASALRTEEQKLQRRKRLRHNNSSSLRVSPKVHSLSRRDNKQQKLLHQYQNKLTLYVVEELRAAVASIPSSTHDSDSELGLSLDEESHDPREDPESGKNTETGEIIKGLFFQVSSTVPEEIRQQLRFKNDVFFYELLSNHLTSESLRSFVETSLLEKCSHLYKYESFPPLFAMLFSKFHLKVEDKNHPDFLKRFEILINGANQILWHDVNQKTTRLFTLFKFLVTQCKELKVMGHLQEQHRKLSELLCQFYYYYCSSNATKVQRFLNEVDVPLERFLIVCVTKVSVMPKKSQVQVHFLQSMIRLRQLDAFSALSTEECPEYAKFQRILVSLSIVGGPFDPESSVRAAAKELLDAFFPSNILSKSFSSLFQYTKPHLWFSTRLDA